MVEPLSPLGAAWVPGRHNVAAGEPGVILTELRPGSIVQVAAWPGAERAALDALAAVAGARLADGAGSGVATPAVSVFGIGPRRFLAVSQIDGLAARLTDELGLENGAVTDLSHGRTGMRVAGPRAEWVLSKLFALDFALAAFPVGAGRSTVHHDVFAQIQRSGPEAFDLFVFRSFARSFWKMLCHAAEDVGYEVR